MLGKSLRSILLVLLVLVGNNFCHKKWSNKLPFNIIFIKYFTQEVDNVEDSFNNFLIEFELIQVRKKVLLDIRVGKTMSSCIVVYVHLLSCISLYLVIFD